MNAGDLGTGREHLTLTARHMRDTGDIANLSRALANLTECLTNLGDTSSAREAGDESLASARSIGGNEYVLNSQVYLGVLASMIHR